MLNARFSTHAARLLFAALIGASVALALRCPSAVHAQSTQLEVETDVVYGYKDGTAMVYDVARPTANATGAGVVFLISGGFFSSREQQAYIAPVAEPLLRAGFTVFNLRQPSTPVYMAPDIYEAVKVGVEHILDNSGRFGVERNRIGSMGMSTGGLLALLLALDYPREVAVSSGERPAAVVAYMPLADLREHVGNVQATPSLGFPPELARAISPVDFVTVVTGVAPSARSAGRMVIVVQRFLALET